MFKLSIDMFAIVNRPTTLLTYNDIWLTMKLYLYVLGLVFNTLQIYNY